MLKKIMIKFFETNKFVTHKFIDAHKFVNNEQS